jgi:hypothetical protein
MGLSCRLPWGKGLDQTEEVESVVQQSREASRLVYYRINGIYILMLVYPVSLTF